MAADGPPTEIELPVRRGTQGEGARPSTERVVVEGTVELVAGAVTIARLQCLPRDLEDLALGFLLAEGLVDEPAMIGRANASADGSRVEIELRGADPDELARRAREMTLASGCGKALVATEVVRRVSAAPSLGFTADEIAACVRDLERRGELFKSTGCVHGAAAWRDGDLIAFREDIGRHNAVDKVAGAALTSGADLRGALVTSTGRLSMEMAAKAVRLGAWGVASRSAPTARAVELAAEFGLVLAGFVRGKRLNLYCGAERLRS